MYLWIGRNCNPNFLTQVLGVPSYAAVPDNLVGNLMLQQFPVSTCCGHFSLLVPKLYSVHQEFLFFLDDGNMTVALSPLTVSAPRAGHCRVTENQSFHWLAEGSEAVLPLPACYQVGNKTSQWLLVNFGQCQIAVI